MYNLIRIREEISTGLRSSLYEEKLYKLRGPEIKEIDYGEWNELKELGVRELSLYDIKVMNNIGRKLTKISNSMKKNLLERNINN